MPVQDDARELEMIQIFNLTVPGDRSRSDIDAHLNIDGHIINFELKSSTSNSVSTVRDFGPEHIRKWRDNLHWIFAFYNKAGTKLEYCIYASPADMEPWIAEREEYIWPDLLLANSLPASASKEILTSMLGDKDTYTRDDARWIMKKQWNSQQYAEQEDAPDGYSQLRMVEILQLRAKYVILRGATLNNPHISKAFFEGFEQIRIEHAAQLRESVRGYLTNAVATEVATA